MFAEIRMFHNDFPSWALKTTTKCPLKVDQIVSSVKNIFYLKYTVAMCYFFSLDISYLNLLSSILMYFETSSYSECMEILPSCGCKYHVKYPLQPHSASKSGQVKTIPCIYNKHNEEDNIGAKSLFLNLSLCSEILLFCQNWLQHWWRLANLGSGSNGR